MTRKLGNIIGLLSIASLVGYSFFFSLPRGEFVFLLIIYTMLFAGFIGVVTVIKNAHNHQLLVPPYSWGKWFYGSSLVWVIFLMGVIFRISLLPYTPNLSQDFFRFIWDGHMLLRGFNPYLYLPDNLIDAGLVSHIPNASFLHANMGYISSSNYTNYPPVNQLFFATAAFLGGKSMFASMVWMRVMIIFFEIGVFIIGIKLLHILGKPLWYMALYFLNPFVIIELSGNLHWEGAMGFFSLLAVYFLFKNQRFKSAIFLGYGVLVKLLPLILLPVFFKRLAFSKAVVFYLTVFVVISIGFLPFLQIDFLTNYSQTVGLWFGNFEYNAGIFRVIKSLGYHFTGTNVIKTVGKILPVITLLIIASLSLFRKNDQPDTLVSTAMFSFTAYLFLSTTVHPWYLLMPLLLSVFTSYKYMLLWSYTVFLSYQGYSNPGNLEYGWLLVFEYVPVYMVLGYELYSNKSVKQQFTAAAIL